MSEKKDFFKTCFDTVAGLEVKNESQAIAKEVVLDEIENLQQENQQLKERINKAIEFMKKYNEVIVPEANIKSLILKEEYKKIIDLLKGDKE